MHEKIAITVLRGGKEMSLALTLDKVGQTERASITKQPEPLKSTASQAEAVRFDPPRLHKP